MCDRAVGHQHVRREPVDVGVDRDRLDAALLAGAHDADGDLAAVGDEDTADRADRWRHRSRDNTQTGRTLHCARPHHRIEPNRRLALTVEVRRCDAIGRTALADPNTRQGKRTPVTLKIKFKSETLEQFIERYAVDVSQGGIFIRTKEPLAVGTQMRFEFQLRDASPLIAGEGTVVWTRENDPSRPAIAPGMGVRFDRLAEGSQTRARAHPLREGEAGAAAPAERDDEAADVHRHADARRAGAGAGSAARRRASAARPQAPDSFGDQGTPLPRPMPFHSDADDFDEEAFEEATKVRALDELIAQTALLRNAGPPMTAPAAPCVAPRARSRAIEETATAVDCRRSATRARGDRPRRSRDSAPILPSPPEPAAPRSRALLDTTPSPRAESASARAARRRRRASAIEPSDAAPTVRRPSPSNQGRATKPTGIHARRRRARTPSPRMPAAKARQRGADRHRRSSSRRRIGAAVWFFILREQVLRATLPAGRQAPGTNRDPGSNADRHPAAATAVAIAPDGSNGSAGSAGSDRPASARAAAARSRRPRRRARRDRDRVERRQGDHRDRRAPISKGPAPLKAKLEKGQAYKVARAGAGLLPRRARR